jgi:competence protein ComGF
MGIINEPVELGKYNVANEKITITLIYHIRNAVCNSTITNVVIMCTIGVMLKKFM